MLTGSGFAASSMAPFRMAAPIRYTMTPVRRPAPPPISIPTASGLGLVGLTSRRRRLLIGLAPRGLRLGFGFASVGFRLLHLDLELHDLDVAARLGAPGPFR